MKTVARITAMLIGMLSFASGLSQVGARVAALPQTLTPRAFLPAVRGGSCPTFTATGWQQIVAGAANGRIGSELAMAQDLCGRPLLAYVWEDPNGDSDYSDSKLYFMRRFTDVFWSAPQVIDTIGDINVNNPFRQVSIAFDVSNGRMGIAYQASFSGTTSVKLALSDDGATWAIETLPKVDVSHNAGQPALALGNGTVYVAVKEDSGVGARYLQRAGPSGSFSISKPPTFADYDPADYSASPMSLELDDTGVPGLAYMNVADFNATGAYTVAVAFWRPGSASAVKVMDSQGAQNDGPTLDLVFDGQNPVVAALLSTDASADAFPWVAKSGNGGVSFAAAHRAPKDGGNVFSAYLAIAQDTAHHARVVSHSGGGNDVDTVCGKPKVSVTTDFVSWTTCGITGVDDVDKDNYDGLWINAATDRGNKLMLAEMADKTGASGGGILLYREP